VTPAVPAELAGERLDLVVARLAGCSRADSRRLIEEGRVRLDGRAATDRSLRVAERAEVDVEGPVAPELVGDATVPFRVVHEDEHVVVVDKPAGVVVHPGGQHRDGTLVQGLLARYPELSGVGAPDRPGIVHRLDLGTSGLLVVARTSEAHQSLTDQLRSRAVRREYDALVWGLLAAATGTVDAPIARSVRDPGRMGVREGGRPARTHYEVRERYRSPVEVTLLRCRLESGRTHQIRVHLSSIGHPVVGDRRYGGQRSGPLRVDRPVLHAAELGFTHPATGDDVRFTAPHPADFEAALAQLEPSP